MVIATKPKRGCGTRVPGGFYAEVPLSPFGLPIEAFVLDPLLEPLIPLPRQGVLIEDRGRVQLVFDRVGATHYHYPADFIEEARRLGISRRIPRSMLGRLRPGAHLVLAHDRVIPVGVDGGPDRCVKGLRVPGAMHTPERCGGWLWHVPGEDGRRALPGLGDEYEVREPVPGAWAPGLFMMAPLARIVYVRGAGEEQDARAEEVLAGLRERGIQAEEVDA